MARTWEMFPSVRGMRRAIAEEVATSAVLEIGCGFGMNLRHMRGPYIGLDLDELMMCKARELHPHAEFLAGTVDDHIAALAGIPLVLFSIVLHELPPGIRRDVLDAAARTASERILIFDYNPQMSAFKKWQISLLEEGPLADFWNFSLADFFHERGWREEGSRPVNHRFYMWRFRKAD
ncbi:MAG: class I SAM-dependent methyltransferase [Candidatus Lernaella stagnicola]|nr:class I SAM-dependent methyltransferase [Candidatus Lernaella stagnicola]